MRYPSRNSSYNNGIISKFDIREDISYYNESEPDIEKLKQAKIEGEKQRTKNDLFFFVEKTRVYLMYNRKLTRFLKESEYDFYIQVNQKNKIRDYGVSLLKTAGLMKKDVLNAPDTLDVSGKNNTLVTVFVSSLADKLRVADSA